MTEVATQIRAEALRLRPTSLSGDGGAKMVYTIHLASDGVLDWFVNGIAARFPTFCPDGGLANLCRDRRIIRGPEEPADAIRIRLRRFRWTAKTLGSAYSVLRALRGHFTPHQPLLRIWTNAGMVYTCAADGTLSWERRLGTWDWDGETAKHWRFWVVIYPPASLWEPAGTVLGGEGPAIVADPGMCLGFTATQSEMIGVREVIRQHKSRNSSCDGVVVAFDDSTFAPATPEPDGGWFKWSVPGVPYTAKRLASARYCRGVD